MPDSDLIKLQTIQNGAVSSCKQTNSNCVYHITPVLHLLHIKLHIQYNILLIKKLFTISRRLMFKNLLPLSRQPSNASVQATSVYRCLYLLPVHTKPLANVLSLMQTLIFGTVCQTMSDTYIRYNNLSLTKHIYLNLTFIHRQS